MKENIRSRLLANVTIPEEHRYRFFKVLPGEYAYHDKFLGVTVPFLRKLAKEIYHLDLIELENLFYSPYNEERLLCLFILIYQYENQKNTIYEFYLKHIKQVNNWNLVDASAHLILGKHLYESSRDFLFNLVVSENMWERRIAIISTWWFIKQNDLSTTIKLAEILLKDEHDLMHKATGWMLRELGKKDEVLLEEFILKNKHNMPRTMLRYAIEKFSPQKRKDFLA